MELPELGCHQSTGHGIEMRVQAHLREKGPEGPQAGPGGKGQRIRQEGRRARTRRPRTICEVTRAADVCKEADEAAPHEGGVPRLDPELQQKPLSKRGQKVIAEGGRGRIGSSHHDGLPSLPEKRAAEPHGAAVAAAADALLQGQQGRAELRDVLSPQRHGAHGRAAGAQAPQDAAGQRGQVDLGEVTQAAGQAQLLQQLSHLPNVHVALDEGVCAAEHQLQIGHGDRRTDARGGDLSSVSHCYKRTTLHHGASSMHAACCVLPKNDRESESLRAWPRPRSSCA